MPLFVRITGSLCGRTLVEFYQMKLSILLICKICKLTKLPEFFIYIFLRSNQETTVCISCSDLSRNSIQGPIPASWADLPVFNLYALHCSHSFVRSMLYSAFLCDYRSFQGNRIFGTLPKELGRMPKLKSMWVAYVRLLQFASSCILVVKLKEEKSYYNNLITNFRRQLEGNQLAGSIPPELGNIISLQRL